MCNFKFETTFAFDLDAKPSYGKSCLSSATNASVNSKCALPPPPPGPDPREFAFFFLWMANSWGRGHLSCQVPGGRDESRRQMPRYT